MKKILSAITAVTLMLSLAACGSTASTTEEETTAAPSTSAAAQTTEAAASTEIGGSVSTDGSTSMESLMMIYGEVYPEIAGTTINYNPTGSGAGIQAVSEGRCDIGLASRDLSDEEVASGLVGTIVAHDGIAIVVNPENPVADLTLEQIAKLYTGEITNWSEVGGNDAPVVLIGRESGSGTRDGFESITDTEDKCQYGQELNSTGDVITTVAGNPNAIGYASLSAVGDNVKAITVGGVAASEETVQDGSYVVQRNFVMVTKADTELSEAAQAFLDWASSADADEFVREAGAVPVVH